jgi:hypothetical protein
VGIVSIGIFAGVVGRESSLQPYSSLLPLFILENVVNCEERAIMTVVQESPETAFVKGGLFAKGGVALPPPGYEVWWKNREKWEVPAVDAVVVD